MPIACIRSIGTLGDTVHLNGIDGILSNQQYSHTQLCIMYTGACPYDSALPYECSEEAWSMLDCVVLAVIKRSLGRYWACLTVIVQARQQAYFHHPKGQGCFAMNKNRCPQQPQALQVVLLCWSV